MKQLVAILKATADSNRLRILGLLSRKELCVCELAHILGITQPSVSRHLRRLQAAGLIAARQRGYWTNYYLAPANQCTKDLLRHLNKWWLGKTDDMKQLSRVTRYSLCRHRDRARAKKGRR